MYMADLLRSVSSSPVGGVLLEEHPDDAAMGETDLERYRPLINVARHYRWSLALRPQGAAVADSPVLAEFDAVLTPAFVVAEPVSTGVDVSAPLWSGGALPALARGQFHFVDIPASQRPEFVLESLARLRA